MSFQRSILLALALFLIVSPSLWAQIEGQKTLTRSVAAEDSFPFDSPLNEIFGPLVSHQPPKIVLVTETIDVKAAVASYAEIKNVDLRQARFDALEYLGATHRQLSRVSNTPKPNFKPLGGDRFDVTATEGYLKTLPARIRSFELGKKSIVVTIDQLHLDDRVRDEVKKFLVADTLEHIPGHIPPVTSNLPTETKGQYRAASTLQVTKSMPLTIGQLTTDNYLRLLKLVRSRKNCEIVSSPTVVSHPGQDAIIHDGSMKPFVIGLNEISGDFTHASQPLIQLLENGNFFKVNCDLVDRQIAMRCSMSFAQILENETIRLRNSESPSTLTVQTPSQQVRVIDISAELASDRVLMLDPYHEVMGSTETNGAVQPQLKNIVTLVRVQVLDDEQN